ncbi:hypothetical protein [Nesterenkonia salmonea]|nr:hypothetical protein [Nesterenkonia salmonea]
MGKGKGRRRGGSKWQQQHRPLTANSMAPGGLTSARVKRRDGEYYVRHISGLAATKEYVCPACTTPISIGTAHIVAWRADWIFGDDSAASERRHWHTHCWRISA